jgi:hypothetical protein
MWLRRYIESGSARLTGDKPPTIGIPRFFDRAKSNIGGVNLVHRAVGGASVDVESACPLDEAVIGDTESPRDVGFDGPIGGGEDGGIAGVRNAAIRLGGSPVRAGFLLLGRFLRGEGARNAFSGGIRDIERGHGRCSRR